MKKKGNTFSNQARMEENITIIITPYGGGTPIKDIRCSESLIRESSFVFERRRLSFAYVQKTKSRALNETNQREEKHNKTRI